MRFEEVYEGWQERRLTQEEAARVLGMSERNFRRHVGRYQADGLDGLMTGASNRSRADARRSTK